MKKLAAYIIYILAVLALAFSDFTLSWSRGKHNILSLLVIGTLTCTFFLSLQNKSITSTLAYNFGFACVIVARFWSQSTGSFSLEELLIRCIGAASMLLLLLTHRNVAPQHK